MKQLSLFIGWLLSHFDVRFVFIPIAIKNIVPKHVGNWVGCSDVFVFGVRVMRIQRTVPWKG